MYEKNVNRSIDKANQYTLASRAKCMNDAEIQPHPQMPRADATLLFGLDVSSYNILANVSEYLPSEKRISANAFSYASSKTLF